ncbi:MAG: MarC family protein [Kiritimatiellia bacterium]|nr:MarC family protein [Lentisphaerota bacterium]
MAATTPYGRRVSCGPVQIVHWRSGSNVKNIDTLVISMKENLIEILVNALYLLALINPISKVSVLSSVSGTDAECQIKPLVGKASIVAAFILLGAMICGDFVLRVVFHVQLHSLQFAGGIVLFSVGFTALRKGVFFERETQASYDDIALVPLACPMIAGPATITACIALQATSGLLLSAAALVVAVSVNYIIMQMSRYISRILERFNFLGALIRITGLVVMTMGVQMAFDGLASWYATLM